MLQFITDASWGLRHANFFLFAADRMSLQSVKLWLTKTPQKNTLRVEFVRFIIIKSVQVEFIYSHWFRTTNLIRFSIGLKWIKFESALKIISNGQVLNSSNVQQLCNLTQFVSKRFISFVSIFFFWTIDRLSITDDETQQIALEMYGNLRYSIINKLILVNSSVSILYCCYQTTRRPICRNCVCKCSKVWIGWIMNRVSYSLPIAAALFFCSNGCSASILDEIEFKLTYWYWNEKEMTR